MDVLGSDDGSGTPSRSDGRLVRRRLATRPATPSTPQVCRRDARRRPARRDGRPRRRPSATDVATSVSRRTVPTTSTMSASGGGRRINDGNCPPVAHRLSRLGRNEFSDAASMNAMKFRRGVVTPTSSRWRQRPVAPVLGRRDARAGEHDTWERPVVDRSLVDCHHLRIWDLNDCAFVLRVNPLTMMLLINYSLLNFICLRCISKILISRSVTYACFKSLKLLKCTLVS